MPALPDLTPAEALESLDGATSTDVATVAILLGLSYDAAYRACREGTVPCIRVGRRYVVPVAPLLDLLGLDDRDDEKHAATVAAVSAS